MYMYTTFHIRMHNSMLTNAHTRMHAYTYTCIYILDVLYGCIDLHAPYSNA